MNKNRKRIMLTMFSILLFTLACGIYAAPGAERNLGDVKCVSKGFDVLEQKTFYTCKCPIDPSYTNAHDISNEDFADPVELRSKACTSYFMHNPNVGPTATATVTSTPTATATATSTPTKAPTATPLPYLSGDVTACNLSDRYINFVIDPNAVDINGLDFEVTIGGVPSTCSIPSSNTGILSCTFPQNQTFPAQVIVNVDGFITNDFTFDGSSCAVNPPPPVNNEEPAPIETPMD